MGPVWDSSRHLRKARTGRRARGSGEIGPRAQGSRSDRARKQTVWGLNRPARPFFGDHRAAANRIPCTVAAETGSSGDDGSCGKKHS